MATGWTGEVGRKSRELISKYDIKTNDAQNPVSSLSGGNQQKLVVGRELDRNPKILFAVHPTRGVDIGATKFIHEQILHARDEGCAVVLISTELDEILELSDRIGVIYEGKILGEMDSDHIDMNRIGLLMAGKKA